MKLTAIIAATALLAVLISLVVRAIRGDFENNPFVPVLMIVVTTGIIGGLCAAATL